MTLEGFGRLLGGSWVSFGHSWAPLERLLGAAWAFRGTFWMLLGRFWEHHAFHGRSQARF